MKVRLLKKLRKRAYKEIGICAYFKSNNQVYYTIERRGDGPIIDIVSDYDNAMIKLNTHRRFDILKWVREMRCEKINKNIKKL